MHIWTLTNWEKYYNLEEKRNRTGLRLKFDTDVDPEVRRAIKEFCKWLRREYFFPIRVPIYVKTSYKIKTMDGELVYGTFFGPFDRNVEPYIRISAGDYYDTVQKNGKDKALGYYLVTIAHELTHYFQWINDIKLTRIGYERQATAYSGYIIDEYKGTREHP
ncbi:hypothetical protein BWGOE4_16160 [Bacillus mycoides]|uniref:Uncharacterized protein n=1 Tax=Bacillus mycoides TaxID=1405 RepID=A0A1D3MJF1_BACMY|nr:hypothetical protein [Bacillus mycoides]MBJ8069588.1 hypothetical protein [Bacillus cereus]MBJ8187482.1 hypothetical protein [Bacillus cereus]OFD51138.1 hypothetical protein BWGOE3_12210 [Bacillus mycoides]OFD62193.1 hypothetical protein BWGOE6_12550 [Bacillus mycoides]OFD64676.1 hypothetical protein BWGOE4_16160 [Bacillus mycoides]